MPEKMSWDYTGKEAARKGTVERCGRLDWCSCASRVCWGLKERVIRQRTDAVPRWRLVVI